MKTEEIGVIGFKNEKDELIGIVHKDGASRKNVLYLCTEMGFEEIKSLLGQGAVSK